MFLNLVVFCLPLVAADFTRAAGPRQTATNPARFGMGVDVNGFMNQLAGPDGERLADRIASLGSGWARFEFKATDPVNLKWYDRAIGRLQSRGLRLLAVLVDPFATCHSDIRETDPLVFSNWVRQIYLKGCSVDGPGTSHQLGFDELTARYPLIQHWQVWNEPNVCGFLKSDLDACGYGLWRRDGPGGERVGVRYGMQKFGQLLATVYAERANKDVKIITGGILNAYNCAPEYETPCNTDAQPGPDNCYRLQPWEKFGCDGGVNLLVNSDAVQKFRREQGRLPFDILGLHPYQHAAWANGYVPPGDYVTQDIRRNVRRFVDSAYPVWITEWSFDLASNTNQPPACRFPANATSGPGCEANIARLLESLVGGINSQPGLNIENFIWFNFADQSPNLQTGLLDAAGRPRPAWSSFQAAARPLGQQTRQEFLKEVWQHIWQRAGDALAVLPR